jgi:hypothetical protein
MTNCVNCGAPIDLHRETCPYCDSPYIDTSKRLSIKKAELEGEILKTKAKVQAESARINALYAMRKYAY